jgi:5-methylcytosine-specific restriction endonuclease McrA
MEITKVCTVCKEQKPLDCFSKNKRQKDGHYYVCRQCKSVLDKNYRERNKRTLSDKAKIKYKHNSKFIINRVTTYRKNNPDKIRQYRENTKEHRKSIKREWDAKNKEHVELYRAKYYQENSTILRENKRKYYLNNKQEILTKRSVYGKVNREKIREKENEYRNKHPDKFHAKQSRRRAREKNAFVETVNRKVVYERDNGICGICGELINLSYTAPHRLSVSIDHIIPLSKGGLHTYDNIQIAHYGCNSSKGNRLYAN